MSLYNDYREKVLPSLQKKLNLSNVNEVPRLTKIVVNTGIGSYITKKDKDYSPITEGLASITGQKPVLMQAKKAVSNFKLRKGMPSGLKVTLRGQKMFTFLERLINVALPRTRDFRGVSKKAFDENGNFSLGIKESVIFPEIRIDDLTKMYGLQINISTTGRTKDQAFALLEAMGMPFVK